MGVFDFLKKKTWQEEANLPAETSTTNDLIAVSDQLLLEVSTDLSGRSAVRLPIAEIATLGGGLSSLLPSLRTITQTATTSGTGLYQLANAGIGDALKTAADGTFWGAMKTASGGSKMAKFIEAGSVTTTTKTVAAINPAMLVMAVSLASIEHKLSEIADMEKQIFSFLEHGAEAKVESALKTLTTIITEYKYNWDNELYCSSHYKQAGEIREKAEEYIRLYQKEIGSAIQHNHGLVIIDNTVEKTKTHLMKRFIYYKLSLYVYSFASMLEVMLLENFQPEFISQIQTTIMDHTKKYQELFSHCYGQIENMAEKTLQTYLYKGVGEACKKMSTTFSKKGPVAQLLVDLSNDLEKVRIQQKNSSINDFVRIENPGNNLFIDDLEQLKRLSSNGTEVYFDKDSVYLVESD